MAALEGHLGLSTGLCVEAMASYFDDTEGVLSFGGVASSILRSVLAHDFEL